MDNFKPFPLIVLTILLLSHVPVGVEGATVKSDYYSHNFYNVTIKGTPICNLSYYYDNGTPRYVDRTEIYFDETITNSADSYIDPTTTINYEIDFDNGPNQAIDDPKVWINKTNRGDSRVYASRKTNTGGGIYTYNLSGSQISFKALGKINSIDIRYDVTIDGNYFGDILMATNRTDDSIIIHQIEGDGTIGRELGHIDISSNTTQTYGGCFYYSIENNKYYVYVSQKSQPYFYQYELSATPSSITGNWVRTLDTGDSGDYMEGMYADDRYGNIYVGVEDIAVYKYGAEVTDTDRTTIATVGNNFTADVEGISMYEMSDGGGILIISSQGSNEIVLYDRVTDNYIGTFKIIGVRQTDGLCAISGSLGETLPYGALLVHNDGSGFDDVRLVDWEDLANSFTPALMKDYSPTKLTNFAVKTVDNLTTDMWGNPTEEDFGYMVLNFSSEINITEFATSEFYEENRDGLHKIDITSFTANTTFTIYGTPIVGNEWYTQGSTNSIYFRDRPMNVMLESKSYGNLLFDITHPTDNSGQPVTFSANYLSANGINNPVFEWEGISIPYTYNGTHYTINPAHFSYIGIHEATTGITTGTIGEGPYAVGTGGSSFNEEILIEGNKKTFAFEPVDLDNDGDIDIIAPDYWERTNWYENDGMGEFTSDYFDGFWSVSAIEAADIDNDGDIDALMAGQEADYISWFEHNGSMSNPGWTEHSLNNTWEYIRGVDIADLDGDGDLDFVAASESGNDDVEMVWWEHNGSMSNPGFTEQIIDITNWGMGGIQAIDLDEDGDCDIVTASRMNNKVSWWSNNGSISNPGWTEIVIHNTSEHYTDIHAIDVDGDLDLDIITTVCTYTGKTIWLENDGSENFLEHDIGIVDFASHGAYGSDLDQDGDIDIITLGYNDGETYYAENDGSENFILHQLRETGTQIGGSYITATDLDADGFDDIIASYYGIKDLYWWRNSYSEQFNITRTIGAIAEKNELRDHTLVYNHTQRNSDYVTIRIPVSSQVTAIVNVTNNTNNILAVEVNSTAELINNTFFYDAANQFVYISTNNLTKGSIINWTVIGNAGATFEISMPEYLEVGDYFEAQGLIKNASGLPLPGLLTTTKIFTLNGTVGVSAGWYCVDGNYQSTLSTSTLLPGIHTAEISFVDELGLTVKYGATLYLSTTPGPDIHVPAKLHFAFYDSDTGEGIDPSLFKTMVSIDKNVDSSDRIYQNEYSAYTGQTLYYKITDYFDNKVFPTNREFRTINITDIDQTETIPINWNDFAVKNLNDTILLFSLSNGSRNYNATLFPGDTYHFKVISGDYQINMTTFDALTGNKLKSTYDNVSITNDRFYICSGFTSHIYFSLFNTNEGLGIPWETLQFYVNGGRLTEDRWYHGYINETVNLVIKDFYNFTMHNANYTLNQTYNFLDLGLTFHSWLFGNNDYEYYMISILRDGATRWFERGIVPQDEREFLLPTGTYTLRIYDGGSNMIYNNASMPMINSRVYVIGPGGNVTVVVEGLSVINGNILQVLGWMQPDIIKVGTNMPYVLTIYECANEFTVNFTKICPPQVLLGTTFTNYDLAANTMYTIDANIPHNETQNGVITTVHDKLWFSGNNADWVNITYNDGTLLQNTSYVPTLLDIKTHNTTLRITSSHNISIIRETRYRQIKEFLWTKYTDTQKYEATINFNNINNISIYDVYLYIGFADDSIPDVTTIGVYDVFNAASLDYGENFDASSTGIQLSLDVMLPSENRSFRCSYYPVAGAIQNRDAIAVINSYNKLEEHNGENYLSVDVQWTNTYSDLFIGPLYVQFNFSLLPDIIDPTSLDLFDENNMRYMTKNEYAFTGSGFTVGQDKMGEVNPGETRKFTLYYQFLSDSQNLPNGQNLLASEFVGPVLWIHVIVVLLVAVGAASILLSHDKSYGRFGIALICLLLAFFAIMAYIL